MIDECVDLIVGKLQNNFELYQKVESPLDSVKELFVDPEAKETFKKNAETYIPIEINKVSNIFIAFLGLLTFIANRALYFWSIKQTVVG